jgi:dUTP pyrophosphatase
VNLLKIKLLRQGATVPAYVSPGATCFDLHACFDSQDCVVTINPGEQKLVGAGLAVAFPAGWGMDVLPRSGHALKARVSVTNSPGQVDSDYRGEVGVILRNDGELPFVIRQGDRIAQARMVQAPRWGFMVVNDLPETDRGVGGFGSTGVS